MEAESEPPRPTWPIDHLLTGLHGRAVRVAAEAFVPRGDHIPTHALLIPTARLILPDGSTPDGRVVYFEGLLEGHVRRIGIVDVVLAEPPTTDDCADGITAFRGRTAVILPGPAIVRLAYPFVIEPIPEVSINYWRDLTRPGVQFELPLGDPARCSQMP
ncbi:MAG: hypothetical protein H7A47_15295 [Verrucomicrobiales bacterium]|nr:hypothetical protein [Verrucomicrobiales bacterium]